MILVVTGLVSIVFAAFDATEMLAPMVYATLPITIGLFAWRYDWNGGAAAVEVQPADAG